MPAWISNQIRYIVWEEIADSFPNFNGATVEVWEWIVSRHTLLDTWLLIHAYYLSNNFRQQHQ